MAMFTLHRTYVLRTNKGHAIAFEKGKPTWVPPMCEADAVAIGAIPVEGDPDVIPKDAPPAPELSPAERKAKIIDAFEKLLARNERGDFTASNQPHCKKLALITDFEVTPAERDEVWQEYQAKKAEAPE